MRRVSAITALRFRSREMTLPILTASMRWSWITFVSATIVVELVSMPEMLRSILYVVWALKFVIFCLVGFLAPLAFDRFNAFLRGLVLGGVTATGIEMLQAVIGTGHSFRLHELIFKLLFIVAGFCMGIVARYESAIILGPISIRLTIPQRIP